MGSRDVTGHKRKMEEGKEKEEWEGEKRERESICAICDI